MEKIARRFLVTAATREAEIRSTVLLAFVIGCCSGAPLVAGEGTNDGVTSIKTVTPREHNPVANGSVAFDVQERLRLEARRNNFDFHDGIDDPADDEWLRYEQPHWSLEAFASSVVVPADAATTIFRSDLYERAVQLAEHSQP